MIITYLKNDECEEGDQYTYGLLTDYVMGGLNLDGICIWPCESCKENFMQFSHHLHNRIIYNILEFRIVYSSCMEK